jgi:hypothetical protein
MSFISIRSAPPASSKRNTLWGTLTRLGLLTPLLELRYYRISIIILPVRAVYVPNYHLLTLNSKQLQLNSHDSPVPISLRLMTCTYLREITINTAIILDILDSDQ